MLMSKKILASSGQSMCEFVCVCVYVCVVCLCLCAGQMKNRGQDCEKIALQMHK